MPKYQVDINEETLHRVDVEADTAEEAEALALKKHLDGKATFVAVLDRDFFACPKKASL